jgi:hypothetical protein
MGIFDYMFDNEWAQRSDINAARSAVDANARSSRRLARNVNELADEVAVLALFVRTLQRLMIEKGVITKDEFLEALRAIDMQDGKLDGKYTRPLDE